MRTNQGDTLLGMLQRYLKSPSACLQVEVVAEVDGWLHCIASNGAKGLVPSSYVQLLGAGGSNGLQQQYSDAVSARQQLYMLPIRLCLRHPWILQVHHGRHARLWHGTVTRCTQKPLVSLNHTLNGFGTTQQTLRCFLRVQLPSQQSFDPLAQPDLLAAFTQKAKEPDSSWMSFDDAEGALPRPFNQTFTGSSTLHWASPASGQVGIRPQTDVEAWPCRPVAESEP